MHYLGKHNNTKLSANTLRDIKIQMGDPEKRESLTLQFPGEFKPAVLEALGELIANGIVEPVPKPHHPFNPALVDTITDPATGDEATAILLDTFRRVAQEIGMNKAMGGRAYTALSFYFHYRPGNPTMSRLVHAEQLPAVVDGLERGNIEIRNLGDESLRLLQHIRDNLYPPEITDQQT